MTKVTVKKANPEAFRSYYTATFSLKSEMRRLEKLRKIKGVRFQKTGMFQYSINVPVAQAAELEKFFETTRGMWDSCTWRQIKFSK